jgi:hypothetical protein
MPFRSTVFSKTKLEQMSLYKFHIRVQLKPWVLFCRKETDVAYPYRQSHSRFRGLTDRLAANPLNFWDDKKIYLSNRFIKRLTFLIGTDLTSIGSRHFLLIMDLREQPKRYL